MWIDEEKGDPAMLFKNLIPDAVQAVHEFHERKLWKRFTNFDCFGIRIPNRQDLLLACVMGDAGEQYGLMMLQGSHAAKSFSALTSEEGPGDDATEAMDMLGFSMSAFGEMATESQAFFRKAGVHPQYDEQVPEFLVKPPNRNVRLPQDEELALLTSIVKAVVAADRRKLLQPAELNDPAGICVITLGEDHENAPPSVARERLPQPEAISQPRAFAASGMDLSDLELLDSIWLVGTPVIPGGIKDDERSMLLLLVADDASEMILQAKPFFSECIQEAVDALVETFRGHQPEGRRGIAQTIVFSNRLLHDTVTPALQEAGVKCIFMPSLPKLQGITKDFLDFMGRKTPSLNEYLEDDQEDEVTPAPDDLAGWKEADYRLSQRFADHLFNGERLHSSRAIKRYFDNDDIEHFFKEHEERGVAMAFSAWGMLDYRPGRNSQTQAEKMLAQGLPDAEAMLLRARMKSYPTFYRVAGHNPKAGTVDLEDVLLGGKVTVHDQLLSENVDNNVFLISRAFPAGRFHFIEVAGPPLGPHMGIEAVEFLRDCDLEFTHEGLKREAHKFGWLWGWIDQWQANWQPPHLCNTDGDDLLVHTASFAVADPDAIKAALLKRKDINHDEQKDEYVWSKNTGKGVKMLGGPVTLGRIEFIDDELVLTVNSARRFKTARAWLTKLPGVSFRNVTTQSVEPGADRPLDSRISKPQPVEITPDMAQNLQEIMDKQYMQWIDTPLPILGGKTPRKACRTDAGREQVTTLIRTIPDPMGSAPVHVPRQAMLRELGLVSEDHGPWLTMPPSPQTPLEPGLFESDTPPSDKVGRNDPCPCGSGKKFKKCCGR